MCNKSYSAIKMTRNFLFAIIWFLAFSSGATDTVPTDAIFNEMVSTLTAKGWIDPSVVIEGQNSLVKEAAFTALKARVRANWRDALLCSINGDSLRIKRTVFLIASQSLEDAAYIDLLKELANEVQQKRFSPHELEIALFPADERLSHVLADSWNKPATRRLIDDLKKIFQDDDALISYLESVLSGSAKDVHADFAMRSRPRPPTDAHSSANHDSNSQMNENSRRHFLAQNQTQHYLGEPASSPIWIIICVLVVVAIGLLWLLLKPRY